MLQLAYAFLNLLIILFDFKTVLSVFLVLALSDDSSTVSLFFLRIFFILDVSGGGRYNVDEFEVYN